MLPMTRRCENQYCRWAKEKGKLREDQCYWQRQLAREQEKGHIHNPESVERTIRSLREQSCHGDFTEILSRVRTRWTEKKQ